MTAANKTITFNKSVVDAQDTSLGQFKTDNPSILMGFPLEKEVVVGKKEKTIVSFEDFFNKLNNLY